MSSGTVEKLIIVFFGWLLGLASPLILEAWRRKRENSLGRNAIRTELNDLKFRLAVAANQVDIHLGTLSREKIETLSSVISERPQNELERRLKQLPDELLPMSDDDLNRIVSLLPRDASNSLSLQRLSLPILDARVNALWSFDTEDQRQLLTIKSSIEVLNETVDRAREFTSLTFKDIAPDILEKVLINLNQCYGQYSDRCYLLIRDISKVRHK